MAILPQGTPTFLFTDIEGSTRLVHELGPSYREVLETHQRLLRSAFHAGVEVGTEGDSFFFAFATAADAVVAAVAGQRALTAHEWPSGHRVRVRMGLHTGEASLGGDSYIGFDVHRAARIAAVGHGGQVLLSESTHALISRDLPDGVTVHDLGSHQLKDLSIPERIFQLVIAGLDANFPALRSLEGGRTNLPGQLTSFVGRERELIDLESLSRAHRLVTVIGTGGTGKTRLMIQAAAEMVSEQPDGVWLVDLAPISDPDLIALAVARALGIRDDPGRPLVETIIDFLRTKSLLLLLDNCEHLIGDVAELTERILVNCQAVSLCASSREALGVAGEQVFQVPSLEIPESPPDADGHATTAGGWFASARESEAVRLFVDRATAVLPGFTLTSDDAPAVVQICRRLDGIPLALELAAARVPVLSVQEIAARLSDRFRLLTGGRRTALPRQQTLQALIDWSWDLLTDEERRLLRRLSVFAGGFTVDAAAEVAGDPSIDVLDVVGHLVGRSLVVVDRRGPTRYRLLETIRQYARDRLVAADETSAARNRHLAYFLRIGVEAEPALSGPKMVLWLSLLDAEADNLRAAVEWGFEEDPPAGLRLCLALVIYWRTRSLAEGFEYLRRAAALAISLPRAGMGETRLVARVLAAAANASWMAGSAAVGRPLAEESLRLARDMDDARTRAEALTAMAMTTMFQGQFDGVVEWIDEAIHLAELIGAWSSIGFIEAGLAQWEVERGDQAAAQARLSRATSAADRSGSPEVIAFTALARGRVYGFGNRIDDARRSFARAIDGYEQLGDHGLALVARSDLAHALRINGAVDEASTLYRQTLHAWQHTGNRGAIANQLESVALMAIAANDDLGAARLLAAAEAIREAAGAPMLVHERADYDEAVATLQDRVDAASLTQAWADGRELTSDDAVGLALAVL